MFDVQCRAELVKLMLPTLRPFTQTKQTVSKLFFPLSITRQGIAQGYPERGREWCGRTVSRYAQGPAESDAHWPLSCCCRLEQRPSKRLDQSRQTDTGVRIHQPSIDWQVNAFVHREGSADTSHQCECIRAHKP